VPAVAADRAVGRAAAIRRSSVGRSLIALLRTLEHPVAADGGAWFDQADLGAAVARVGVAVVAGLGSDHQMVAADGHAATPGDRALPSGFDRGAVGGAAVAVRHVAVVADLGRAEQTVAAHARDGDARGRRAARATDGVAGDLTERGAAVARVLVAVVARFARVENSVP